MKMKENGRRLRRAFLALIPWIRQFGCLSISMCAREGIFVIQIDLIQLNTSTATGSSVGVVLIGPGRCGKVHLKNIVSNPRMTVEWLVDINEEIPATVKQDFNLDCKIATYDTIDQALQDNRQVNVFI